MPTHAYLNPSTALGLAALVNSSMVSPGWGVRQPPYSSFVRSCAALTGCVLEIMATEFDDLNAISQMMVAYPWGNSRVLANPLCAKTPPLRVQVSVALLLTAPKQIDRARPG